MNRSRSAATVEQGDIQDHKSPPNHLSGTDRVPSCDRNLHKPHRPPEEKKQKN